MCCIVRVLLLCFGLVCFRFGLFGRIVVPLLLVLVASGCVLYSVAHEECRNDDDDDDDGSSAHSH